MLASGDAYRGVESFKFLVTWLSRGTDSEKNALPYSCICVLTERVFASVARPVEYLFQCWLIAALVWSTED